MLNSLKSEFLLDPDVIFLNHGSFGACPRPVFEAYQQWQRELERQPVDLFGRRSAALLAEARAKLAAYLNVEADNVVYFPNPTTAMNVAARSLALPRPGQSPLLAPGDEILTTDQEYPAMDRTWEFIAHITAARYVHQPIPLPLTSEADFVDALWAGVNERTRVIFLSHITCSTALIFPVQEVCRRAREAGIITIVDGAHAVSQIPLDLTAIGADIYAGACHKWLCAPKGAAFLYARPAAQAWLEPLVVSRGWGHQPPAGVSSLVAYHEGQGTRDLSAFLSVPAAIAFQAEHDWDSQRRRCHALASATRRRLNAFTGLDSLCPDSEQWFSQMVSIRIPGGAPGQEGAPALVELRNRLYQDYHIEMPVMNWRGQGLIRVSLQAYNDESDVDTLIEALERWLPQAAQPAR